MNEQSENKATVSVETAAGRHDYYLTSKERQIAENMPFIKFLSKKKPVIKNDKDEWIVDQSAPVTPKYVFLNSSFITVCRITPLYIDLETAHAGHFKFITAFNLGFVEWFAPDLITDEFLQVIDEYLKLWDGDETTQLKIADTSFGQTTFAWKERPNVPGIAL